MWKRPCSALTSPWKTNKHVHPWSCPWSFFFPELCTQVSADPISFSVTAQPDWPLLSLCTTSAVQAPLPFGRLQETPDQPAVLPLHLCHLPSTWHVTLMLRSLQWIPLPITSDPKWQVWPPRPSMAQSTLSSLPCLATPLPPGKLRVNQQFCPLRASPLQPCSLGSLSSCSTGPASPVLPGWSLLSPPPGLSLNIVFPQRASLPTKLKSGLLPVSTHNMHQDV